MGNYSLIGGIYKVAISKNLTFLGEFGRLEQLFTRLPTMKKLSRKTNSQLTMLFCAIILGYFGIIKKDTDNPIIFFVAIYMVLESLYYFWQFYKKNDTVELKDKW